MSQVYYGFLDESPALTDRDQFFLIGLFTTQQAELRKLLRITRRVRERKLEKKLDRVPELKFNRSSGTVRRYLLNQLAKEAVQIVIYAVDTQGRLVEDTPENYGIVVGNAVATYLHEIGGVLNLKLDQKYTAPTDRSRMDDTVLRVLSYKQVGGAVSVIDHVESYQNGLVQLADFVAGAAHRKYNLGDQSYLRIVGNKIVLEEVNKWVDIKAEFVEQQKRR